MVYSVAHYILILDIGISTTMVRYISKYRSAGDKKGEENFAAHCFFIAFAVMILIVIAGIVLNSFLLDIYPSIPKAQHLEAHGIFIIMIATLVATIAERFLEGIIIAYEHFVIVKSLAIVKVIIKIVVTVVMLMSGLNMVALALADLIVEIVVIIFLGFYSFAVLKFKIALSKFKKSLLFSIFSFMFAIFLQSVVSYINNMVDKTILGIMTTARDVAIYSVAMTFITMFNSLPTAISSVFLPQATRIVAKEPDRKELTEFVSRPGRYQFMLCGALVCGFTLFGREFITLWVGKDSLAAWGISLIIMIPNMIPLIQNTVVCILDAKKKRLFRSITLLIMSLLHIVISIVLVDRFGILGAPIGSAIAYIIGYGIILNIYYHNVIGINVPLLFKTIFSRTWLCLLISSLIALPLNIFITRISWLILIIKIVVFCILYAVSLLLFGLNKHEKNDITSMFKKFVNR